MHIQRREPDYDGINKKVSAEFECRHTETVRCKKVKSDQQIEIRDQCKRCGDKVGNAIRKNTVTKQEIERLPLWDDQIGVRFATTRNDRFNDFYQEDKQRIYEEWHRHYHGYLATPEWQAKRQLVLLRAQGICEGCRAAPATEVHHITYEHEGEEFLFELVAVCRKCHARLHPSASSPPSKP